MKKRLKLHRQTLRQLDHLDDFAGAAPTTFPGCYTQRFSCPATCLPTACIPVLCNTGATLTVSCQIC